MEKSLVDSFLAESLPTPETSAQVKQTTMKFEDLDDDSENPDSPRENRDFL